MGQVEEKSDAPHCWASEPRSANNAECLIGGSDYKLTGTPASRERRCRPCQLKAGAPSSCPKQLDGLILKPVS